MGRTTYNILKLKLRRKQHNKTCDMKLDALTRIPSVVLFSRWRTRVISRLEIVSISFASICSHLHLLASVQIRIACPVWLLHLYHPPMMRVGNHRLQGGMKRKHQHVLVSLPTQPFSLEMENATRSIDSMCPIN